MIEIRGCTKSFRGHRGRPDLLVLDRVDLTVADHEFASVLGPSGCGKTTLLKIVAGLVQPDAGEVRIDEAGVTGPGPDRGFVFQNFALLPWADVLENVAFGLELRGVPRAERVGLARDLVRTVGLTGFEHAYPRQLSGGMQQRVGLARALAIDPKVLLMDEPFGSVDSQTRRQLQEDVLRLHQRDRKTVIFVTHSVDEAARLADRVVLLTPRPGRVAETVDVGLPRPRPPDLDADRHFVELKQHLWSQLKTAWPAARSDSSWQPA